MNTTFAILVQELDNEGLLYGDVATCLDETSFMHIFDENIPVRTRWLSYADCLSIDACIEDISGFPEPARVLYLEALLRLNALTMHGRYLSVQVDSSDMVCVSRRIMLDELTTDDLCCEIDDIVQQSRRVRKHLRMACAFPDFEAIPELLDEDNGSAERSVR